MDRISIGADPEFPIFDRKSNKFIAPSTIGFSGTKDDPEDIPFLGGCKSQVDGLALEFNTPPSYTSSSFSHYIHHIKHHYKEQLRAKSVAYGMDLVPVYTPLYRFEQDYFESLKEDDKILGCSPDYDKDGNIKESPSFLMNSPFRTAAGHIHIGWSENEDISEGSFHFQDCVYVAQRFYESGIFAPKSEAEKERMKFYGGDGAFRPKPYGIEIRSPSNEWLSSTDTIRKVFTDSFNIMWEILNEA